jgi:hypothetical protein
MNEHQQQEEVQVQSSNENRHSSLTTTRLLSLVECMMVFTVVGIIVAAVLVWALQF